jgi:NAD(P)-dependent dehydrogenase (short-subunit alcohol dehydrogenase family)
MGILDKKYIIVTGGSGLIGKEILKDLLRKGAMVINFDISDSGIEDVIEIICDITKDISLKESVDDVIKRYGKIDGLVNNAYPRTQDWGFAFEDIRPESLRKNVDWQFNSHFILSQIVLEIMKKQSSGSVVNIASAYGVVGNDFTVYEGTKMTSPAAYSAIKGGIINLTRYLASYYGKHNVRVNCVSPGGIFDNQPEQFVNAYEKKVPMKRMGNPDDIAPAISFLLSDEAKYITGHNLIVDGGWTAI